VIATVVNRTIFMPPRVEQFRVPIAKAAGHAWLAQRVPLSLARLPILINLIRDDPSARQAGGKKSDVRCNSGGLTNLRRAW
jgi:hypothetical protein